MKHFLLAFSGMAALVFAQPSFAGFRFNHKIYECKLDSLASSGTITSLTASIYEAAPEGSDLKQDLAGQWLVSGTIYTVTGRANFMGGSVVSTSWLNPDVVRIKERPEILAEEPTSLSLSLNMRTLRGEVTHKRWDGYAPIGFPAVKITAPIECKKVDQYFN